MSEASNQIEDVSTTNTRTTTEGSGSPTSYGLPRRLFNWHVHITPFLLTTSLLTEENTM